MGATSIQAVIFDLDGTLVDSLEDIASALGGALADAGLARPPVELVRAWIGDGAHSLVRRAVEGRADVDAVFASFRERYRAQPIVTTRLYDGVAAALDELAGPGRSFAVLSNKPHELTKVIADRLLGAWPFAAVFGQRPGLPLKPDPTVALVAADELGVSPARCAFVGDSAIDVETARAAGMRAVAVAWGFRDRVELEAAQPDVIVDEPRQLAAAIA
ncbi:MAG TPA: HAD-IA family hydrolase [Kofleriaceae bacterium]|nr:HAD-IA family hydrolase [Kofleriaceae bacterium]